MTLNLLVSSQNTDTSLVEGAALLVFVCSVIGVVALSYIRSVWFVS
jgi:hypothetical protein